jgi:hypothetical protein
VSFRGKDKIWIKDEILNLSWDWDRHWEHQKKFEKDAKIDTKHYPMDN